MNAPIRPRSDRGARIAVNYAVAQVLALRPAFGGAAPLGERTTRRIIAAAIARISPEETAAALGWPVGQLLAVERAIGLRVTVTLEVGT